VTSDRVIAVLGVSPSLAEIERRQALATATALGVDCREVRTYELDDPDYVANRGNRCYFCKFELYTRAFTDGVAALGSDLLVNGDTADDHEAPDRPGRRAAGELGVGSPLAAAGIRKAEVRALAHALGLPVWDKPSAPCLASRVPVDTPVTRERLALVEQAEAALRGLGLRHLRVRHLGERARVELGPEEHARLDDAGLRAQLMHTVQAAGYVEVELSERPLDRS
jgi:pyridinium-3,5-biscarboxylic acid mononucleotide sulfurtransferase